MRDGVRASVWFLIFFRGGVSCMNFDEGNRPIPIVTYLPVFVRGISLKVIFRSQSVDKFPGIHTSLFAIGISSIGHCSRISFFVRSPCPNRLAGVEPRYVEYDGDNPYQFVISNKLPNVIRCQGSENSGGVAKWNHIV